MEPTSPGPRPRLGQAIRRARERKRWTQRQLADALAVSLRAVNDWENDRAVPRLLGEVEQVLGINLDGEEKQPDVLPPLVRDNYDDEAVRIIWSRELISRDARLGLIAYYVGLRNEANGGT